MISNNDRNDLDLNTAIGMYKFVVDQGMGVETNEKWGIKHFGQIYLSLIPDEKVEYPFLGVLENSTSIACAITNKRLIIGKKTLFGAISKTINLDKINDISVSTGPIYAQITINSNNDQFSLYVIKSKAQIIHGMLNDKIQNSHFREAKAGENDKFEEIREYKKLMEEGIITKEEFDKKKKELLNI